MTKQVLDYANVRSTRPLTMRGLHFARWAAIIPLVTGTAITSLFVLTRASVLPWLGLLCIGLGGLSVLAGFAALVQHAVTHCWKGARSAQVVWREVLVALALLLVNIPVCYWCVKIGQSEMLRVRVAFVNDTATTVKSVRLLTIFGTTLVDDLPPGGRQAVTVGLRNETGITGTAVVGGTSVAFTVDGYFESTSGPYKRTVRFERPSTQPSVK